MIVEKLKKWVGDAFTEPNTDIVCPVRVLAICGFIWALWMNGWSVLMLKVPFDIMAFGGAYGVMLASLGVALGFKTDSKGTPNVVTTP
jgi:hypothetical protein